MLDFKNSSKKVYLIGDIGINHNADLNIAKKLIDAASGCQWDCVKFQKKEPDLCVPEDQKNKPKSTPWGQMTYLDYKKKMEFGKAEYDYIDKYCKDKPIDWTASVWDIPSLKFILNYNIPFIKIPSAKLTEEELLIESAKSGRPLLISTGMSTLEEIDNAVAILEKYNAQYALMHCNSSYPAPSEELNLNCIKALKRRYGCSIGYSGHEYDLEPSVCAVALGANIVERHITLDHNMWGTDQKASLEVHAMDLLRKRIKDVNDFLGDGNRVVTEGEKEVRKKLRGY